MRTKRKKKYKDGKLLRRRTGRTKGGNGRGLRQVTGGKNAATGYNCAGGLGAGIAGNRQELRGETGRTKGGNEPGLRKVTRDEMRGGATITRGGLGVSIVRTSNSYTGNTVPQLSLLYVSCFYIS